MMADLVHEHVLDDSAEGLATRSPVFEDRPPVEPDHVRHLHRCADRAERQADALEQAEQVELASGPHPALWRQFAQSLGVTDASLDSARPLPGIAALLDTYDEVSSQGTLTQAVASFYAYEAQVPEIATQKISGLRRFYNIMEPKALAYFGVHQEADVRHRAAWRAWLAAQKDEDAFGVLCWAERSLKALWGALDAVYPQTKATRN